MNALQIDPASGFLHSVGPAQYGFTPEKKLQFLELAKEYRTQGKFPSVSAICSQIGINFSTFERHLATDEQFKAIWQEIASSVEYECIGDMHDLRKKNPMYMFGLLRYLNPKRWHPDNKGETTLNINVFSEAIKEAQTVRDAVIVDNSPAIAPQIEQSSTVEQVLAKDLSTGDGGVAAKQGGYELPHAPPATATSPPSNSHKTKSVDKNLNPQNIKSVSDGNPAAPSPSVVPEAAVKNSNKKYKKAKS